MLTFKAPADLTAADLSAFASISGLDEEGDHVVVLRLGVARLYAPDAPADFTALLVVTAPHAQVAQRLVELGAPADMLLV